MSPEVRILLLEDNPVDAELIERELRGAGLVCCLLRVRNKKEFIAVGGHFAPDLVLSDNSVPAFDALSAMSVARLLHPGIPFIVVSGTVGEERAVELLKCGATDYVLKDRLGRLGPVVIRAMAEAAQRRGASEAAEATREANERFRTTSENAPIGIFQTDAENRFVFTNARWSEIAGVPADRALGLRWDAIAGFEHLARARTDDNQTPESADVSQRFAISRPGADPRIVLMTSRPMHARGGEVTGRVGTLADITEVAGAEAAMAAARDKANEASRLKSHFLSNMSHEIRTPMIGVIGMTNLLLETELDAVQRDYAQTVLNSSDLMMNVVNDVLDFSAIESGTLDMEDIEFAVEKIVDDVVDVLAPSAHAKGLGLIAVTAPSVPVLVTGDPGRLRQVLTNLVGNAVKFTEAGEVVVRVSGGTPKGGAAEVRFEISDTGVGMTPEHLARIFEPFLQADTSSSRKYGGTGLGLAISGRLTTLMGGELRAESQLGVGSIFRFAIAVRAEARDVPVAASPPMPELAGVSVLVVAGSATLRDLLCDYLESWGVCVQTVDSGPAALIALRTAEVENSPVTAVLLDRFLPAKDGLELARTISAAPGPSPRLVLMTAVGRTEAREALRSGISAVVAKPVHREGLHKALLIALADDIDHSGTDHPPAEACTRSGPARLLLAEDNLINQRVTVAMLSSMGYHVDTVTDGAQAVVAAESLAYDAILMDCQMPELDGYQATAAIRALEGSRRHTPIIALTAGARPEDRERCLAGGMDDYLAKPVRKDALLAIVEGALTTTALVSHGPG